MIDMPENASPILDNLLFIAYPVVCISFVYILNKILKKRMFKVIKE